MEVQDMKVTVTCPICNEEISISGVKLITESSAPKKSYVGWGGNGEKKPNGSINVSPPKDENKELEDALDKAISKAPPPIPPPPPTKVEHKEAPKQEYGITHIDNTKEEARDIIKKMAEKREEDKISDEVSDKLLKLGNDIKPDIHTIAEALAKQATESKKKGLCLLCNKNPGTNENMICDECLDTYIKRKAEEEHKLQLVRTLW